MGNSRWSFLKAFTSVPTSPSDTHESQYVTATDIANGGNSHRALDVNVLNSVNLAHNLVHSGQLFEVSHIYPTILNNTSATFYIACGANEVHCVFVAAVEGASEFRFYENPTISLTGTSLVPKSFNRVTETSYLSTWAYDTVTNTVGSLLTESFLPAGTKNKLTGGQSGGLPSGAEWILKPNTDYLLELINKSGANEIVSLDAIFYEESP